MNYAEFLETKRDKVEACGFDVPDAALNPALFEWQRRIVSWSLRKGRAALFEDCGLGKTAQQLEWARHVAAHTGRAVLILAPLAVSDQTIREGRKFGVDVRRCREAGDVVLSPFMGIGSEGYVAIRHGRRFVGCELKPSYFRVACENLRDAERTIIGREDTLFAL